MRRRRRSVFGDLTDGLLAGFECGPQAKIDFSSCSMNLREENMSKTASKAMPLILCG